MNKSLFMVGMCWAILCYGMETPKKIYKKNDTVSLLNSFEHCNEVIKYHLLSGPQRELVSSDGTINQKYVSLDIIANKLQKISTKYSKGRLNHFALALQEKMITIIESINEKAAFDRYCDECPAAYHGFNPAEQAIQDLYNPAKKLALIPTITKENIVLNGTLFSLLMGIASAPVLTNPSDHYVGRYAALKNCLQSSFLPYIPAILKHTPLTPEQLKTLEGVNLKADLLLTEKIMTAKKGSWVSVEEVYAISKNTARMRSGLRGIIAKHTIVDATLLATAKE